MLCIVCICKTDLNFIFPEYIKNEENLKQIIFHSLLEIQQIVRVTSNQQHLVNLANKLVNLQEELQDPNKSIDAVLPPATNMNTKGRKKDTKRLDILVEIVRKEDEAKAAKKRKDEKLDEKKKRKLENAEQNAAKKMKLSSVIHINTCLSNSKETNQYDTVLRDNTLKSE
jgi:hypothetical protein